jgi:hypothetical protein
MGYFRKKRDRVVEGQWKLALRAGAPGPLAQMHDGRTFAEWRYVRVAVPAWHWDTGRGQGIFQVAGAVQDTMRLSDEQRRQLDAAMRWFNRRLPVPYVGRRWDTKAIFWLKYDATECRRRIAQLARQLRALGITVEVRQTARPGKIVYEDDFQIAAVPGDDDAGP